MLQKKERLSREAFNRFFSIGKRLHTPSLQLIHHPYESFHASVVVPKKVLRSSVERNKMRRRIYDILRRSGRVKNTGGVFIVIVKQGAAQLSYEELAHELTNVIGRVRN